MTGSRVLLAAALLLAGCATEHGASEVYAPGAGQAPSGALQGYYPPAPGGAISATPPQSMTLQPPQPIVPNFPHTIQESNTGPAVLALYSQAQQARQSAQLPRADALLERALRIEPRNAWVWQALANVHLTMNEFDQAENEARKSNSLARGNPYLTSSNWRLIATSRQTRGDAAGAQQAAIKADEVSRTLGQ